MYTPRKSFTLIAISVLLAACATTNAENKAIESGGEIVELDMLDLIGNDGSTSVSKDGNWVSYYSADGRKAIKLLRDGGKIIELAWRENDQGEFCEQVFSANKKEFCGDAAGITTVKNTDGSYSNFRAGNSVGGSYTVENGNTYDL